MRELAVQQQPSALFKTIDLGRFRELMDLWQHGLKELSPATRTTYRRGVARFFDWLTEQGRVEMIVGTVLAWSSELKEQGTNNKEIAAQLVITPGTVTQNTHKIYRKLMVKNQASGS